MFFYLSPWEWIVDPDEEYWRSPNEQAISTLDLRTLPQKSQRGGTPGGFGIFGYDSVMTLPRSVSLGNDVESFLSVQTKLDLESALGLSLSSSRLLDAIWELLTVHTDPIGQTRCKPLRPTSKGVLELWLGDFSSIRSLDAAHLVNVVEVYRADYRRQRSVAPLEALQRFTATTARKIFGRIDQSEVESILPPEHVADGWVAPRTTIGDTFTDTNGTAIESHTATGPNGGFSWTEFDGPANWEINTNAVRLAGTVNGYVRAESDLSSDDHYSECELVATGAAGVTMGPIARKDNTATLTWYEANLRSANTWRLRSVIADSATTIASTSASPSAGDILQIECNGSTIRLLVNDSQILSTTDSDISGNLRCGLTSEGDFRLDNFEAADLASETITVDKWHREPQIPNPPTPVGIPY